MVEKDEPIPMVIKNPTINIKNAANPLESPTTSTADDIKVSMPPVLFITSAKPEAAIMMKPIIAIMCTPLVKTSSVSENLMTPPKVKMINPASEPKMMESA